MPQATHRRSLSRGKAWFGEIPFGDARPEK